jgi:hypothetical protein
MLSVSYNCETKEFKVEGAPLSGIFHDEDDMMDISILMNGRECRGVIRRTKNALNSFLNYCVFECNKALAA